MMDLKGESTAFLERGGKNSRLGRGAGEKEKIGRGYCLGL